MVAYRNGFNTLRLTVVATEQENFNYPSSRIAQFGGVFVITQKCVLKIQLQAYNAHTEYFEGKKRMPKVEKINTCTQKCGATVSIGAEKGIKSQKKVTFYFHFPKGALTPPSIS